MFDSDVRIVGEPFFWNGGIVLYILEKGNCTKQKRKRILSLAFLWDDYPVQITDWCAHDCESQFIDALCSKMHGRVRWTFPDGVRYKEMRDEIRRALKNWCPLVGLDVVVRQRQLWAGE